MPGSSIIGWSSSGLGKAPKADRTRVFNMGGAAVANYVSILERQD